MSPTVSAKKPAVGAAAKTLPYTGREYLDSLDDGREIWIYGERVVKITEHPAFQNCARMIARLYDALHEDHNSGMNVLTMPTEWGGFTHRYFKAPTNIEEQVAGRDAIYPQPPFFSPASRTSVGPARTSQKFGSTSSDTAGRPNSARQPRIGILLPLEGSGTVAQQN